MSGRKNTNTLTFQSNKGAPKGTAIVQDFETGIDTLALDGSFGIDSASYEATYDGLFVSFDNGSDVLFVGLGFDDPFVVGSPLAFSHSTM
ncbi:MAG: hypothetical protein ACJAR9_000569 [Celeribacter sp.]